MKLFCPLKSMIMVAACCLLGFSAAKADTRAEVVYALRYEPGQSGVSITMTLPRPVSGSRFAVPRSAPGMPMIIDYSAYFMDVVGVGADGERVDAKAGWGSYYEFAGPVKSISWFVDLASMEDGLLDAASSSKLRDDYVGMLGYSVFGYVPEYEAAPVILAVTVPDDWPVFSSLAPTLDRPLGTARFTAENFAALADRQYFLGNNVQVWSSIGATNIDAPPPVPVFVAAYAETGIDVAEIGRRGVLALNGLDAYFGFTPMPFYTIFYEYLEPRSPRHEYGFAMEHMNSMTSSLTVDRAITGYEENPRISGIVHHIGHSWFPLRSYGEGYRPFEWETAPMIDTIWLNEGFIWYVTQYQVLKNKNATAFFERRLAEAPDFVRNKGLRELSLLGSTQYATDFRIGISLFSRGALFARDLDVAIGTQTGGRKSFKDALLNLYRWTEKNQRGFKYDEVLPIMSEGLGVDLTDVWREWQTKN